MRLVCSSSTAAMKFEAGAKVRGRAFLYPGLYMSSCNSPWGDTPSRTEEEEFYPVTWCSACFSELSTQRRGVLFCPMLMRELSFVLEFLRVFSCEGRSTVGGRCHGAASADCLKTEVLFLQHGIKFHFNLLQRYAGVLHYTAKNVFSPRYMGLCVFSPTWVPLKCVWCGQMQKRSSCLGFNHYPSLIWAQWGIDGN